MSSEIRNLQRQVEQQNKYVKKIGDMHEVLMKEYQSDLLIYFVCISQVNLNIMVAGESGVGKTTFINSFLCHVRRISSKIKSNANLRLFSTG